MIMNKLIKASVMALTVSMAGMGGANASLLQLTHDPLFLNQTVPPAIAVTMDDSGSMAWSYMGSSTRGNTFADPEQNRIYYNPNITYTPPLRYDGTRMPNSNPSDAWVDGYPNDMTDTVDLTQDYVPVREYVYSRTGNDVTIRLTYVNAVPNVNSTRIDDNRYTNYHPNFRTWGTTAFYLTAIRDKNGDITGYDINYITDKDELQNFANWYSYYNSRMKLARAAISRAFANFGPSFKLGWQEINYQDYFTNLNKFEQDHREDFYDWLFGVPTQSGTPLRSAFKRTTDLFKKTGSYYSEDFKTNLSCQQNFHIAISDGEWNGDSGYNSGNDGFLQDEQNFTLPGDNLNRYTGYNGNGEQVIYEASENGSTLADIAFDAWARDLVPGLNNNVRRFKKDYTDGDGAEIDFSNVDDEWDHPAFMWNPKNDPAYWQHVVTYNVGLGLEASRILEYQAGDYDNCPFIDGLEPKEAVYRSLRSDATAAQNCDWPAAGNAGAKVDDVWHASLNSRGGFFSANDPNELIEALNEVVNNILERLSRGSTSTVSSGVITSVTEAYTPGFDSANWTGNLFARDVNSQGNFSDTIKWDTACILTQEPPASCDQVEPSPHQPFSDRRIYVYDKANQTTSMLTSLSSEMSAKLGKNAVEMLDRTGGSLDQLVAYIQGDQSTEAPFGPFRPRESVLSDIVHSAPFLQRGPSANYNDRYWGEGAPETDDTYLDFKTDNQDRENTLFIGSNGGMLHAIKIENRGINANPGSEIWSYIPSKAFENIHRLADPKFKHWSYVDNSPRVTDAYFDGDWHSVLVGGMRYGGQAFYALDVTDPVSNGPEVLWEFTDADDPDMGFSYGEATITRLSSTGEWVALIPNGYNNSENDYEDANDPRNIIGDGTAVLYVVSVEDGKLLARLDTNVGSQATPNGMAPAVPIDSEFVKQGVVQAPAPDNNFNIDIGTDFAYAGDLYGNLWRFDLRSKNPSDWEKAITRVIKADNIKHRPITVKPVVVPVPNTSPVGGQQTKDDVVVVVGTGKYIEVPDRSINLPDDQYLFGVFDGITSGDENLSIEDAKFIDRTFVSNGSRLRNIDEIEIADLAHFNNDYGWKLKLPEQGERLANPMALIGGKIVLASSTVTAGIDPCEGGGRSWLISFDPVTGGRPTVGSIFDDEIVTGTDPNGDPITAILEGDAILVNDLIVGRPPILENQGGGNINVVIEGAENTEVISLTQFTWRRRNWTNLLTE